MKKLLLLICALASCGAAYAGNYRSMTVLTSDGKNVAFNFTDKFAASFTDYALVVYDGIIKLEVPKASIKGFEFSESATTGVNNVVVDEAVVVDGKCVKFLGVAPGTTVVAYRINGTVAAKSVSDSASTAALDLSQAAAGTYIIKAGARTFKIVLP